MGKYIKDIKITFLDTAQYFHSKQQRKSFEQIFSLKFVQVGYKRPTSLFSNKYCDLLIHASFTKFTGPAKLFLNNNIFYFLKKKCAFWDFCSDKACREVS